MSASGGGRVRGDESSSFQPKVDDSLTGGSLRSAPSSPSRVTTQEKADESSGQKEIHPLVAMLKSEDFEQRRKAAECLKKAGAAAVPALIAALADKDGCLRRRAACVLGEIGAPAKDAIPKLVELLGDAHVQSHAAQALAKIGQDSVPALAEALASPDAGVREYAAQTLGMMGTKAETALPRLTLALEDEVSTVRIQAAYALWRVQPTSDEAVPVLPVLLQGLKDQDRETRKESAKLLGYLGSWHAKESREAIPALIASLNDEDPVVRSTVVAALSNKSGAEQPLIEALTHHDATIRKGAAEALGLSYSKTALPALKEPLQDEDPEVRVAARSAIERIEKGFPYRCGGSMIGRSSDWTYHCLE